MKTLIVLVVMVVQLVVWPLGAPAMDKAQLIDAIAGDSGLTKADAKKAVDAAIKAVTSTLKKGGEVTILGFGSMSVENGPAGKTLQFQPGEDLRGALSLSSSSSGSAPVTPPPAPSPTSCIQSISRISQILNPGQEQGSFSITAGNACKWYITKEAGWITLTSGESGKGNGTVTFTVKPNTSYDRRMGYITVNVGDRVFTATQYGRGGSKAEGKPRPQ